MRHLKYLSIIFFFLLYPALSSGVPDDPNTGKEKSTEQYLGLWNGVYHYPQGSGIEPVKFEMILIQHGNTVAGFMKEPNTFGKRKEPLLHAVFKGALIKKPGS